jgi:hypothetical protein
VTYTPTQEGTATGVITATSAGAESLTINLSSTTVTKPVLTSSKSSISFSTTPGTPVKKTFTVRGTNLTANVSLKVSGAEFSTDLSTITMANAKTGKTVTVTYNPTEAGSHTGTITIASTGAEPITVALNGSANDDTPKIFVNPASLDFNAATGETVNKTITVSGANLTGDLALTLNDESGAYSISRTGVTAAQATSGATVSVIYAPTTYGTQNATITISGGGAANVTVNLSGEATLTKFGPTMLQPNDAYVALTQFRAEWTDETPAANVASYTLEVTPKVVEPQLLASLDGSVYTGSYNDITLTAPWGGANVRGGNGAIYFRTSSTSPGNLTFTVPEGYSNATFTMMIKTTSTSYGAGNFTVATPQTAAVSKYIASGATAYWVVTASSGEKITVTTTDNSFSADMALIQVYSGDATPATLLASETGNANQRLVEGITPDKFYTVKDLTAAGTFLYRVKALYIDGTESDWSNIEEVTLHENAHPYALGDVNHDGDIDVNDVTMLISHILGNDNGICLICGDLTGDETIDVSDVTAMISLILNAGSTNNAAPVLNTQALPEK